MLGNLRCSTLYAVNVENGHTHYILGEQQGQGYWRSFACALLCFTKSKCLLWSPRFRTDAHTLLSQHYLSQDTVSLSYHINRCNLHCKLTLLYRPLWSLSQPLILLGISVSSSVGHCPTLSQLVYPLDIFGILQCILNTKMMNEWNGNIFAPGESTMKTQTRLQWRGVGEIMTTALILNPKTRNSVQ